MESLLCGKQLRPATFGVGSPQKRRRLMEPGSSSIGVLPDGYWTARDMGRMQESAQPSSLISSVRKRGFSPTSKTPSGDVGSTRRKYGDTHGGRHGVTEGAPCSSKTSAVHSEIDGIGESWDGFLRICFRCVALGVALSFCLATPACPLSFCLPFGVLGGLALGLCITGFWLEDCWSPGFVYHHLLHADLSLEEQQDPNMLDLTPPTYF